MDQAAIPVKLDIYEEMPHDYQYILLGTPESNLAISKMNDFLKEHLIKWQIMLHLRIQTPHFASFDV